MGSGGEKVGGRLVEKGFGMVYLQMYQQLLTLLLREQGCLIAQVLDSLDDLPGAGDVGVIVHLGSGRQQVDGRVEDSGSEV